MTLKYATWSNTWERQATATQPDLYFFVGQSVPTTFYPHARTGGDMTIAYVDPTCPYQPAHESWAQVLSTRVGVGPSPTFVPCLWLQVSQPALFKVLFWYDPHGVPIDPWDNASPTYWYQSSFVLAHGCSWVDYPIEGGEYECTFERRSIRVIRKLRTLKEARLATHTQQEEEKNLDVRG